MTTKPMTPESSIFYGVSFNTKDRTTRAFHPEEFVRELQDTDTFSWIDIEATDIGSLNQVLRQIDLDLVLVGNFHRPEVLPRIVINPDCVAFYLYVVVNPEQHLDTSRALTEIDYARMILVLSKDYVITYHQRPLRAVDDVKESCEDNFRLAGKTPGFIAFLFLQQCLHDYAHVNLANDNYLDALEAGAFSGGHIEMAERISVAGSNILTLKKMIASLLIILMLLVTKRNRFISEESLIAFNQMLQNTLAIRASNDSSRDVLGGVVDSLQVSAANRTSKIATVLTVVSAVFLPLSLIAGIYGMNTEMPELKRTLSLFLIAGIVAILVMVMAVTFRRFGRAGRSLTREAEKVTSA
jgi:magnesium transporter